MAVDIRATVTCSLGTLISGSISDDYLQGSGLVKTKGSVEISGLITPAVGTAVTFSYVKGGVTRSIPRKLRVLSSFADPFRRTTKVELGCKLTYLSDLQEKVDWTAFDDPQNADKTEADAAIVTLPIAASSVANKCLNKLGITASSMPLTNQFSVEKFDFSPGYVQVLSDLLVSESYFGYLNANEVLQVVSLKADPGTGPVFTATEIVDLGPINSGQLPGEAVTVSYSTLKLKNPEESVSSADLLPGWEKEENSTAFAVPIAYDNNGTAATRTFNVLSTVEVITTYATITTTAGETIRVVSKRETTEATGSVAIAGGLVTEYLSNGITFNNQTVYKYTTEKFAYDLAGNESSYERVVTGSAGHLAGSAGVPWVFGPSDYVTVFFANILPLEAEQRYTTTVGDRQKVQIYLYGPWGRTIEGQQSIAAARDSFTSSSSVANYLALMFDPGLNPNKSAYGLSLLDYRTTINRRTEAQVAPSQADMLNANKAADSGDPNNGWRTESSSDLELALGSATAQRRIELSMPYAPDDVFSGPSGGPFTATPSDADEKARRYGRVQNRLLLGNRNGMNLQLAPEKLPAAPFAPMYVQANGLTALYRANANQWTFSSEGIVCSTDALFWAAVGGTGTFWFPVAPGVTSLPTAPPVVSGEMTATTEVLPYNETVVTAGVVRTQVEVQSLPYALQLLTPCSMTTITSVNVETLIQQFTGAVVFSFDGSNGDISTTSDSPYSISPTFYGQASISTAQSKFGGSSLYFGTTPLKYVQFDLTSGFNAEDWCVEFWLYVPVLSRVASFFPIYAVGDHYIGFYNNTNVLSAYIEGPDSEITSSFSKGQWHHVALWSIGNTCRMAVDGTVSGTVASGAVTTTSSRHVLGNYAPREGDPHWDGAEAVYMDEFRVTVGSAVYGTSNFTPPSAPF